MIDWNKHFETAETRKLKYLRWVPVPNNQSDPGYLSLVARENGAAMLGAWIAILQLASRSKQEFRGMLVEGNGNPYSIETIALVVRMPVDLVRQTVVLLTTEIPWLEWVCDPSDDAVCDPSLPTSGEPPGVPGESQRGMEWKGTERNFDHVEIALSQRTHCGPNTERGARDAQKITAVVRPSRASDWAFVTKVCWLMQLGGLAEWAVWDALEGVRLAKGVKNRMGYFRTALTEKIGDEDLGRLLVDARPSVDFARACSRKPEPRLMGKPA